MDRKCFLCNQKTHILSERKKSLIKRKETIMENIKRCDEIILNDALHGMGFCIRKSPVDNTLYLWDTRMNCYINDYEDNKPMELSYTTLLIDRLENYIYDSYIEDLKNEMKVYGIADNSQTDTVHYISAMTKFVDNHRDEIEELELLCDYDRVNKINLSSLYKLQLHKEILSDFGGLATRSYKKAQCTIARDYEFEFKKIVHNELSSLNIYGSLSFDEDTSSYIFTDMDSKMKYLYSSSLFKSILLSDYANRLVKDTETNFSKILEKPFDRNAFLQTILKELVELFEDSTLEGVKHAFMTYDNNYINIIPQEIIELYVDALKSALDTDKIANYNFCLNVTKDNKIDAIEMFKGDIYKRIPFNAPLIYDGTISEETEANYGIYSAYKYINDDIVEYKKEKIFERNDD